MYYMIKSGTTALTNNDNLQGAADLLTLYSPAKSLFAQVSRMDRLSADYGVKSIDFTP